MKKLIFSMMLLVALLGLIGCDSLVRSAHTHIYGEWEITKAATCMTTGEKERDCTCGEVQKRTIEIVAHSWKTATCTAPKICETCGTIEGNALGHSYQESITQVATCTADGIKTFTCEVCNDHYTEAFQMPTYTSSDLFAYVEKSVAEILTYDKSGAEYALGSGFVYSVDGKIITNYHVIEDAYSAQVTIDGKSYPVEKLLSYDKTIDVAVLQINANNLPTIPVCDAELKTGGTVYAIGSSQGLTATISDGIISHAAREMDGVIYVQHNAAISSGNSGGPLVNEYGEIIGINTFTIRDSQNLNFAIFVSELDKLSYNTPLTMAQLYEKECDPFSRIKNHVISNGTYDASDNEYTLTIGTSYSNDYSTRYTRQVAYNLSDNTITLFFFIDASYMISIEIDEIDGIYTWSYYDEDDYYMYGTLYASTYNKNTLLGYSYNNIYSSSLRTSIRELASSMVNYLCGVIDEDLEDIGVTAYDLGFLQY